MAHTIPATRASPALVIYLLDISESMGWPLPREKFPRIEHVNQAMPKVLERMVEDSTRGGIISPRYRLAMVAYNDEPIDLLDGGIHTIDFIARQGMPRFAKTEGVTNTAAAFMWARDLLGQELPKLRKRHPAPLVCHLTDGEYSYSDPEPIAQEIMQMSNDDGNVLVENIYVGTDLTVEPITDVEAWPGVQDVSELKSEYAQKLFNMSSPLPDSYAKKINEEGYAMEPGSRMLIPGTNYDLIELAFMMSDATPIG